eukprot:3862466-Pleurochrysis_carterae.AAC.3
MLWLEAVRLERRAGNRKASPSFTSSFRARRRSCTKHARVALLPHRLVCTQPPSVNSASYGLESLVVLSVHQALCPHSLRAETLEAPHIDVRTSARSEPRRNPGPVVKQDSSTFGHAMPTRLRLGGRASRRAAASQAALTLMAKALQQCRSAGVLWAEAIAMEQRAQQKTKSSDALKVSAIRGESHLRL